MQNCCSRANDVLCVSWLSAAEGTFCSLDVEVLVLRTCGSPSTSAFQPLSKTASWTQRHTVRFYSFRCSLLTKKLKFAERNWATEDVIDDLSSVGKFEVTSQMRQSSANLQTASVETLTICNIYFWCCNVTEGPLFHRSASFGLTL